jgi:hypothetical protein
MNIFKTILRITFLYHNSQRNGSFYHKKAFIPCLIFSNIPFFNKKQWASHFSLNFEI